MRLLKKTTYSTAIKHLLWLVPFFCFFSGYLFLKNVCVVNHIEVPCLVGKKIHQVTTLLSDLNLNLRIIAQKEDADLKPGTIIHQDPAPGSMIKPHQSVFLVMSCLPEKPCMPSLLGKQKEEVATELENAHIPYSFFTIASSHPHNTCCAQSPSEGQYITNKAVVYLSGNANKPVIMPSLKSKSVEDVQQFLSQYPINTEIIHTFAQPFGHRCQECVVIDQRPLEGSIITLMPDKKIIVQLKVACR